MTPRRHLRLLTVALVFAFFAVPARALADTGSSVAMFSDPGDWIGQGMQQEFDSSNASVTISGSAAYLTVHVSGGTSAAYYDFDFAAPPGQDLTPGVYVGAQRAPFRQAGRPGIDIYGSGRGCNETTGNFEVKDIHADLSGQVDRLWIIFEQHCEGGPSALFGEVRIAEPTSSPGPIVPTSVRWPASDANRASTVVPVRVTATNAAITVSSTSLQGSGAASFRIRLDDCSGRTLVVGTSCQVWLRYTPATAGTRLASLVVQDLGGNQWSVPLEGFAYGGTTHVQMTSDPGDYIGGGSTWSYDVATDGIYAGGSRQHVGFAVDGANGDWWYADFVPGSGDILAPGQYTGATRYPFNGTGPGLDVDGNGRGCNTLTGEFTVTSASFNDDGTLRGFGVSFIQHCEGAAPALRGTFAYRAGDTTPLPPWLIGSNSPPSSPEPPAPPPPPSPLPPPAPSQPAPPVLPSGTSTTASAPDTRIVAGPPATTRQRRATFRFVSTEPGSTFACKLDAKPWKHCSATKTYVALRRGLHRFAVRARSPGGKFDPTPARRIWRIR